MFFVLKLKTIQIAHCNGTFCLLLHREFIKYVLR